MASAKRTPGKLTGTSLGDILAAHGTSPRRTKPSR
jgi:hypothetical protein